MEIEKREKIIRTITNKSILIKKKTKILKEIDQKFQNAGLFTDFKTAKKYIEKYSNNKKEIFNFLTNIGFINFELKNYNRTIDFLTKSYHTFASEFSYKEKTDILDKLGLSHEKKGKFQEALEYFQQGLKLSEQEENKKDINYFCNNAGNMYLKLDNYKKALHHYKTAYKLSIELQNNKSLAKCLINIGNAYARLSNYEKALENYQKSFKITKKSDNKNGIASSLNNIGLVYFKLNNFKKALEFIDKAIEIYKKTNNKLKIASSLNNVGIIYDQMKNFRKALAYHKKVIKMREQLGNNLDISGSLNNIGNVFHYQKEYKKALEYYHRTLKIHEERNNRLGKIIVYDNLGNTYLKLKEYKTAFLYLDKGLKIAKKIASKEILDRIYSSLSDYYSEINDYKKALSYHKKYTDSKDEIQKEKTGKKITELQINFELEQKEKENEIEKLRKFKDKYSLINKELQQRIEKNFIGESKAIKEILKETLNAAKYKDTNVIITGESGTGKEIIARIIHHASERKENGFFPVNCSAIPETLLESEFFGHKKGTFTGAIEDKKGLFELAHKGTLFLDEIADMTTALQAKLLRAIEEKKIRKIGFEEGIPVDVRIIAATNQDINELVKNQKFRLDLFHRLNTLIINIAPLRERPEDIEPLVKHFVEFFIRKINKLKPKIDDKVLDFLKNYDFPGNVRELKNLVERALIICENNILDKKCFPLPSSDRFSNKFTVLNIKQNEKMLIKAALKETDNNQIKAAKILGISRHTLMRRISKLKIK